MAKAVKLEVKEETVETYPDIDIPELLPDRMRGDSFDHSEELPQETPNPKENHDLMDEHDPDTSKENDIDDMERKKRRTMTNPIPKKPKRNQLSLLMIPMSNNLNPPLQHLQRNLLPLRPFNQSNWNCLKMHTSR